MCPRFLLDIQCCASPLKWRLYAPMYSCRRSQGITATIGGLRLGYSSVRLHDQQPRYPRLYIPTKHTVPSPLDQHCRIATFPREHKGLLVDSAQRCPSWGTKIRVRCISAYSRGSEGNRSSRLCQSHCRSVILDTPPSGGTVHVLPENQKHPQHTP